MYVLTSLVGIFELRCYTPSSSVRVGGVKEGEILQETLIGGKTPFWFVTTCSWGVSGQIVLTFLHEMYMKLGQGRWRSMCVGVCSHSLIVCLR